MICVSINYKKADADIRGKFVFDRDKQIEISHSLSELGVSENVILCTCSRTEIYACGDITEEDIMSVLSQASGIADIKQCAMIFCKNAAVNHLFRVACGIDSMVMGEDEILGQTRDAYKEASERGSVSHELNMIFQSALACAKKIKNDTSLSGVPVSTATLAANEASAFGEKILIIGASGKIGLSTLKNLLAHKNVDVKVTSRKHIPDVGEKLREKITIVPYEERYKYIDGADCIISATSSPVYTLTYDKITESIISDKPRLFIDLAVPRDIDENISKEKNIRLLGIDHFEKLSKNNSEIKLSAREKAEAIIADETETLRKNMTMQKFLLSAEKAKKALEEKGLDTLVYKLKSELDAEKFEAVINVISDYGKE